MSIQPVEVLSSELRCSHCSEDNLESLHFWEDVGAKRSILGTREGKIIVQSLVEDYDLESAFNPHIFCSTCNKSTPVRESAIEFESSDVFPTPCTTKMLADSQIVDGFISIMMIAYDPIEETVPSCEVDWGKMLDLFTEALAVRGQLHRFVNVKNPLAKPLASVLALIDKHGIGDNDTENAVVLDPARRALRIATGEIGI